MLTGSQPGSAIMKPAKEHGSFVPEGSSSGKDDYAPDDFAYGASAAHCSAQVRNGFLRKVYGLLATQLLGTTALCCLLMFHAPSRAFALGSPPLLYVSLFASFGFLFACHAYKERHPLNLALLSGFTLSIGYSVGVVCATYAANGMGLVVLQAFLLTAAVTVGLTAYTLRSGRDFSFLGAGLHGLLFMLVVGGFLNALVGWLTGAALLRGTMSFVWSLLGASVFSGFMCAPLRASSAAPARPSPPAAHARAPLPGAPPPAACTIRG